MEISFKKYLLSAAIGFGIGGAIWGGVLYKSNDVLESPFYYLATLIFGILGGISLTFFSKNIKQILMTIGLGIIGLALGFIIAAFGAYDFYIAGSIILSPLRYFINVITWNNLFNIAPKLTIGEFFLNFTIAGLFIGLFFAIATKTKIWSVVWRGGVGFGLGSLIGPVIGNLIGNLFNLLLVSYLITFSIIGIILGVFLAWGIYKNQKANIKN